VVRRAALTSGSRSKSGTSNHHDGSHTNVGEDGGITHGENNFPKQPGNRRDASGVAAGSCGRRGWRRSLVAGQAGVRGARPGGTGLRSGLLVLFDLHDGRYRCDKSRGQRLRGRVRNPSRLRFVGPFRRLPPPHISTKPFQAVPRAHPIRAGVQGVARRAPDGGARGNEIHFLGTVRT
jgi:hypothetical protein